jgi:AraC-like DNA-binding protein
MSRLIVVSDSRLMAEMIQRICRECPGADRRFSSDGGLVVIVGVAANRTRSEFLRRTEEFVVERCVDGDLSLDELCSELAVSRSTFYRRIRQESGVSPGAFIRGLRLELASHLISGGLTVTEGAFVAGFASPSSFCQAFRTRFGVPPSCFKDRCEEATCAPATPNRRSEKHHVGSEFRIGQDLVPG